MTNDMTFRVDKMPGNL